MLEYVALEEAFPTIEEVVMAKPPPINDADTTMKAATPANATVMTTDGNNSNNVKAEEELSGI